MEVELEELNNAEDEVKLGFKELKETIIKAEPLKGKARLDLIEDCHRLLKRIERSLKLYSLGIRSLDTDDVTEYKEVKHTHIIVIVYHNSFFFKFVIVVVV